MYLTIEVDIRRDSRLKKFTHFFSGISSNTIRFINNRSGVIPMLHRVKYTQPLRMLSGCIQIYLKGPTRNFRRDSSYRKRVLIVP